MRLADFIDANHESILAEWVAFAETCGPAGARMDVAGLRDHAQAMLRVIVTDLRTPQTALEQADKGRGNAPDLEDTDTAAAVHGAGRADSGFTVGEMISEYRALRASVLRLWTRENGTLTGADIDDLMRFNEAIDQSLAESITHYAEIVDRSKDMFVAVLGHDLRTPLGAVIMASRFMLDTGELQEPHLTLTARISRSAIRMNEMVADLLEFTRNRLGTGVPLARQEMNLATEAAHAIGEITSANPDSVLKLNVSGDVTGEWDQARIGQVISNLLGNAVQHGTPKSTISVTVRGETHEVVLQIHNRGPAIPPEEMPGLFSPFKRLRSNVPAESASTNLGLGLYIVERIVAAHAGSMDVQSTDGAGTFFTVRLPRVAPAPAR
jgi:signal transduction histidine kinase